MNNDQGCQDCKSCEPVNKFAKCKAKHPNHQKILLECGEGTGSRVFTSTNDAPFQLAYVTLDTTCLNRPEVLVKFSSIVDIVGLSSIGSVRLQYELFRVCGDAEPKLLGVWRFEKVNFRSAAFDRLEESFSFIFCECTNCPRCCEYFVTVTPIEITEATATVSNGRMSALSQPLCDSLKGENKTYLPNYDDTKFKLKHPRPKEVLLACGQGNGSVTFRAEQPSVNIAHVTIDTSCLSKPKVLIEFSSIIKIDEDVRDVSLQFELLRVCGDKEPLSLGIWNFKRIDNNDASEVNKTFDFTFCECKAPEGCCEYFVMITPLEVNIDDARADVVVDNVRMVALAQLSGGSNDCKILDREIECIDCVPKHPTAKKILLECGEGTGSKTFTSSNDPAFLLAWVTIDTTCLCKPMINIEFSSLVSFEVLVDNAVDGIILYELFRVCDNRKAISIGTWVLERIEFETIGRSTNIFNFTFCDCITCPGCCEYFVTAKPIEISAEGITATVSNGRMAALAQEG
ncbi:DUF4489 domain-containing protein [Wukongibacter baidiensis]|uniref:DUF4489 domain-containing protein n=1 Tax=Wukongibacter baidiensis TaxID=1723361 RepID=UPI003D7F3A9D